MKFMLRAARLTDIEQIDGIAREAFGPMSLAGSVTASLGEGCQHVIVSDDGGVNGFIVFSLVAGEAEIYHIAVSSAARRRGIGEALVKKLLSLAESVFLDVRMSNTAAIELYKKCGFKAVNTRKNYYSNGENAIVMKAKGEMNRGIDIGD